MVDLHRPGSRSTGRFTSRMAGHAEGWREQGISRLQDVSPPQVVASAGSKIIGVSPGFGRLEKLGQIYNPERWHWSYFGNLLHFTGNSKSGVRYGNNPTAFFDLVFRCYPYFSRLKNLQIKTRKKIMEFQFSWIVFF